MKLFQATLFFLSLSFSLRAQPLEEILSENQRRALEELKNYTPEVVARFHENSRSRFLDERYKIFDFSSRRLYRVPENHLMKDLRDDKIYKAPKDLILSLSPEKDYKDRLYLKDDEDQKIMVLRSEGVEDVTELFDLDHTPNTYTTYEQDPIESRDKEYKVSMGFFYQFEMLETSAFANLFQQNISSVQGHHGKIKSSFEGILPLEFGLVMSARNINIKFKNNDLGTWQNTNGGAFITYDLWNWEKWAFNIRLEGLASLTGRLKSPSTGTVKTRVLTLDPGVAFRGPLWGGLFALGFGYQRHWFTLRTRPDENFTSFENPVSGYSLSMGWSLTN